MSQLLHLRLGRFFAAVSGSQSDRPWRDALGKPEGMTTCLEMTARLDELAHLSCRAIEWHSATEAWLDLGTGRGATSPWVIADRLRESAKALLPVEVACGVAATKAASRAASKLAAPNGLLVVLPGYETSILSLAKADETFEAFRPSLVPRAIVRSRLIEGALDIGDARLSHLVRDAARGLAQLGVLASMMRLQFATAAGVREALVTLTDPTALDSVLLDAAKPLARKVLQGGVGPGQLVVSLAQLQPAPPQGTLFGLARTSGVSFR
jgi:hypothetical protein